MTATLFGFPGVSSNFTLGGGSYSAIYPVDDLFDADLANVARTADATTGSTVITGTCATAQTVGVIGLLFNRKGLGVPTLAATIRLRLYSDEALTSVVLDTTALTAWPGGSIIDPDWYWCHATPGSNYTNIKGFRIDIADTANPDGFLDFAYLEIATGALAPFQFVPGAQRGRRLRSTSSETPGGRKIFRRRASPRLLSATFDADDSEVMSLYLEMWRVNDLDVPFIVMPHPDDPTHWNQNTMLCRFADPGPMANYTAYNRSQATIKVEQVI